MTPRYLRPWLLCDRTVLVRPTKMLPLCLNDWSKKSADKWSLMIWPISKKKSESDSVNHQMNERQWHLFFWMERNW